MLLLQFHFDKCSALIEKKHVIVSENTFSEITT